MLHQRHSTSLLYGYCKDCKSNPAQAAKTPFCHCSIFWYWRTPLILQKCWRQQRVCRNLTAIGSSFACQFDTVCICRLTLLLLSSEVLRRYHVLRCQWCKITKCDVMDDRDAKTMNLRISKRYCWVVCRQQGGIFPPIFHVHSILLHDKLFPPRWFGAKSHSFWSD
jgi:hypothetical protein